MGWISLRVVIRTRTSESCKNLERVESQPNSSAKKQEKMLPLLISFFPNITSSLERESGKSKERLSSPCNPTPRHFFLGFA